MSPFHGARMRVDEPTTRLGTLVERTMIDVDPLRDAQIGFGRVERYDRGQHRPEEVSTRSCSEGGDHRTHRHAEDDEHADEREHAVARR